MKKIKILLAEPDDYKCQLLESICNSARIKCETEVFTDGQSLAYHLEYTSRPPDITFLNADVITGDKDYLTSIKDSQGLGNSIIVAYSDRNVQPLQNDAFVKGVNIYFTLPSIPGNLAKMVSEIIYLSMQYINEGFSRNSFMVTYNTA